MDMNDVPFQKFIENRDAWAIKDDYCNPGAVQFGGAGSWNTTLSLQIEKHDYLKRIQHLREQLNEIGNICLPGCDDIFGREMRKIGAEVHLYCFRLQADFVPNAFITKGSLIICSIMDSPEKASTMLIVLKKTKLCLR